MYEVSDQYPAEKTLAELSDRLSAAGWLPTDEDLFNKPGTTLRRKWGLVTEGNETHFSWSGNWNDKTGNVLSVNLRNRVTSPMTAGSAKPLTLDDSMRIEVAQFSAELANAIRQTLQK